MSTTTILIIAAVFLAGLASGALIIWWVLRHRKMPLTPKMNLTKLLLKENILPAAQARSLVFRWNYVIVPLCLAISCLLTAIAFVFLLPSQFAFRFNADGSVAASMNKYVFVILMAAAQLLCALAALSIAQVIVRLGEKMYKTGEPQINLNGLVSLMSNMVLLPQVILAYLMLDTFVYGVWSRHLISTRSFALTAVIIGSVILCAMFIRLASRARSALNKQ